MKREFAVVAPDARVLWLLPAVSAAAALAGITYAATVQEEPMLWLLLPVILGIFTLPAFVLRRRRVTLDAGSLTIAAGVLTRRVPAVDLDLDAARIVDLRERSEWSPLIKLFGTRLPGFSGGHFRLRDRSKAFVLLTARNRVLMLPETSGTKLLLSLQQPQALLDALQKPRD